MPTSGSWQAIAKSGAGSAYVVLSGDYLDLIVDAINALGSLKLNPDSNVGSFSMDRKQAILTLDRVDQRLSNLEAKSFGTQLVGNATANCVGNVITFTFSP